MKHRALVLSACTSAMLMATPQGSSAQRETGFENPYYTSGTEIAPATLVPTVRKWYLPQRLYSLYDWRQDNYSSYARDRYERYNDVFLEGSPFYDLYGNYITQGWQVYNWTENYPTQNGSNIEKDGRFSSWFNNILISSSHTGQFHSSLMVGDGIRTTLTPLTFSKPRFDGVQWDMMTDKYALTLLSSRVSNTGQVASVEGEAGVQFSTFTNLWAARGEADVGDFLTLGGTFVNAAHRNSEVPFGDNSLQGLLSGPMNADFVRSIIVRITDDSPEDNEGGALLSRWQIFIDGVEHTDDIEPTVEGGLRSRGVIEASGQDVLTLTFNIEDFSPSVEDEIDDFRQIKAVEIGLVLANDYKVDITSNKQTNDLGTPVFLPMLRAPGNVKDGSNQAFHRFRYGLPTANRLLGFDVTIKDIAGFELRGEFVRNSQFRRFPNENFTRKQALAKNEADAMYMTAQQKTYPWTVFGEAFSIDADYSTSAFIPNQEGEVQYDSVERNVFEFVDDNDDQDELPDWTRRSFGERVNTRQGRGLLTDNAVFPGIDENNDDISDFNRNFNREPDYTEPFLRFDVDPPEFLFGMDMNNNTVIDRFEDDTEADYPYKRGHRGYNAYLGLEIAPGATVMVGRLDERLLKTARNNESTYLLFTAKKEVPERDLMVRLVVNPRKVQDDIADDVFQWVDTPGTRGGAILTRDQLVARDVFANSTFLEVRYDRFLPFTTKIKHDLYNHLGSQGDELRNQSFLGVINKGEYPLEAGTFDILPRWKQQYSHRVSADRGVAKTEELTEIFSVQAAHNINSNINVTAGAEYELFYNLRKRTDPLPPGFLEDSNTVILAGQVANNSSYLGYELTTNVGVRWVRQDPHGEPSSSELFSFITVFAGLGTDR